MLASLTCSDAPTGPRQGAPAALEVVGGTDQQGTVGAELPAPLSVRVLDASGRPVAREPVTFHVAAGGGLLDRSETATTVLSSSDGRVEVRWTLGIRASAGQRVEARLPSGVAGAQGVVAFTATALPAAPDTLTIHGGSQQSARVGTTLPETLVVRVVDRYGNPVPAVPVRWQLAGTSVPALLRDSISITNDGGLAATQLTVGTTPGAVAAMATIAAAEGGTRSVEFASVALAGAPAMFTLLTGAQQTATAGTLLPLTPAALLQDSLGNPLSGIAVRVQVTRGNGTLAGLDHPTSAATMMTNDSGIIRAPWQIGTAAGDNELQLAVEGLAALSVSALGRPDAPALLERWLGDGQTAAPGETVAVAPGVRVTDRFGNVIRDVAVSFEVVSGAGEVVAGAATTDSSGIASAGGWRLGAERGFNTLRARVTGDSAPPPVLFSAVAAFTSPNIVFGDGVPAPASLLGDSVPVAYRVLSARPLARVQASIGGRTAVLASSADRWTGTLDLREMAAGPVTLVITATDVDGRVADLVLSLLLDRPPQLVIEAPGIDRVAAPTITAQARCIDEDGEAEPTCRVTAMLDGDPAGRVEGTGRVTATFRLQAWDLGATLRFVATDSSGQQVTRTRYVYASPSGRWQPWAAVAGVPIDAGGDRVLYHAQADSGGPAFGLMLSERTTGHVDTLELTTVPQRASLGPRGAIWWIELPSSLREWRDGAVHELLAWGILHATNYRYALIWYPGNPVPPSAWYVRDLEAGTTTQLTGSPVSIPPNAALGPDGSVIFGGIAFYGVPSLMRWRSGVYTELLPPPPYPSAGSFATDGINVMYGYTTPQPHMESRIGFWRESPGPVLTAGLTDGNQRRCGVGWCYALAGGWAAIVVHQWSYTSDGITARLIPVEVIGSTIRVLSPGGVITDVRRGDRWQAIEDISPDGLLIFRTQTERFAWREGMAAPESLGPAQGTALWRAGEWFLLLGREVLRLQ